jgi:hypothetical protein
MTAPSTVVETRQRPERGRSDRAASLTASSLARGARGTRTRMRGGITLSQPAAARIGRDSARLSLREEGLVGLDGAGPQDHDEHRRQDQEDRGEQELQRHLLGHLLRSLSPLLSQLRCLSS